MTTSLQFELSQPQATRAVLGHGDELVRALADALTVDIHVRGARIHVEGDPVDVETARQVMEQLAGLSVRGVQLTAADVRRSADILRESPQTRLEDLFLHTIVQGTGHRGVTPKTPTQRVYVEQIRRHDVVFGVGPAGTGKTYLAVAMAVAALQQRKVRRLVLTRPAVEAGERLGFLPGDLQEKVSPYLRPLQDALLDLVGPERTAQWMEKGVVEVAPLAFMRGRTLQDAFIILDEAQNTTREQMKMFLTRLGEGSCAVVTGDLTQVDLPHASQSGLRHALALLRGVEGIAVCEFTGADVVRHPLVRRIIAAYELAEEEDALRHAASDRSNPR
jgi:phosphate starvation-inducible PhoH-like protein